jgi:hypothetical protein
MTDDFDLQLTEHVPAEPPRKRGRPSGLPKTGGRVKNLPDESTLLHEASVAALQAAIDILNGRPRLTTGPTGKDFYARPSLDLVARTAKWVIGKRVPDLANLAVQADVKGKVRVEDQVSDRALARIILNILQTANVSGKPDQDHLRLAGETVIGETGDAS